MKPFVCRKKKKGDAERRRAPPRQRRLPTVSGVKDKRRAVSPPIFREGGGYPHREKGEGGALKGGKVFMNGCQCEQIRPKGKKRVARRFLTEGGGRLRGGGGGESRDLHCGRKAIHV